MRMIFDEFLKNVDRACNKEIFYGEDYDLIETLIRSKEEPSFFSDLQNFLENPNTSYFKNPKETSKQIVENIEQYVKPKTSLAYYTSVDTAYKLIDKGEFWLRNTAY